MELVITYKEPTSPWAVWAATAWSLLALTILKFGDRVSETLGAFKNGATPVGALGFTAVIFAPSALLLASAWIDETEKQDAVWDALFLAIICVALFLVFRGRLARPIIVFAISRVIWNAAYRANAGKSWVPPVLSFWLALSFIAGLMCLVSRETPMCWDGSAWTASASLGNADCRNDIVDSIEGARALVAVAAGLLGAVVMLLTWQQGD